MNSLTADFGFSIGYFGKLPKFPDFVKYNAAGPEILIFDKWIQEGMLWGKKEKSHNSQAGMQKIYPVSSPFSFLFPFTGTDNILTGMLYPSRDKSGREFPFIIFMIINRNRFNNLPACLLPLSFCRWFDYCGDLFTELSSAAPGGKENFFPLNHKMNDTAGTPFDLEKNFFQRLKASYDKFISETSQKEFREKILEDADNTKFPALLSTLEKGLSFLRYKQNAAVSFGILISLNRKNEYIFYNMAFFINLVMVIAGKESLFPALFIENGEHSSQLFIFFSSPSPQQYWDLFYNGGSNERILNANAGINSGEISFFKNLSENHELKLRDILTGLRSNTKA